MLPLTLRNFCQGYNRRGGFRITMFDERSRGDNWELRLERMVVAGE
jgi:hypothetical protein